MNLYFTTTGLCHWSIKAAIYKVRQEGDFGLGTVVCPPLMWKHHKPHLPLQPSHDAEVALIVRTHGGLGAFAQLSDAALQLRVVPLQPAPSPGSWPAVIQELHGLLRGC